MQDNKEVTSPDGNGQLPTCQLNPGVITNNNDKAMTSNLPPPDQKRLQIPTQVP